MVAQALHRDAAADARPGPAGDGALQPLDRVGARGPHGAPVVGEREAEHGAAGRADAAQREAAVVALEEHRAEPVVAAEVEHVGPVRIDAGDVHAAVDAEGPRDLVHRHAAVVAAKEHRHAAGRIRGHVNPPRVRRGDVDGLAEEPVEPGARAPALSAVGRDVERVLARRAQQRHEVRAIGGVREVAEALRRRPGSRRPRAVRRRAREEAREGRHHRGAPSADGERRVPGARRGEGLLAHPGPVAPAVARDLQPEGRAEQQHVVRRARSSDEVVRRRKAAVGLRRGRSEDAQRCDANLEKHGEPTRGGLHRDGTIPRCGRSGGPIRRALGVAHLHPHRVVSAAIVGGPPRLLCAGNSRYSARTRPARSERARRGRLAHE